LIRQIDDLTRADLVNLRDWYFFWLLVATGIVAFGILLEGPEVVFETIGLVRRIHRSEHERPAWMVWLASVGWLFIVIGVTGEGVAEALVSKADALIQTFNDIVVTATQHEIVQAEELAGNAKTSSGEAANAAQRAVEAAKLAENIARSARQEADSFEKEISLARKQATEAESHLSEVLRRAEEIEQRIAWRTLTRGQQESIFKKMQPLGPQQLDIFMYPNDPEISQITEQIAECLPGWQFHVIQPLAGGFTPGIIIEFDPKDNLAMQRSKTLVSALLECKLAVRGPIPSLPTPPDKLPAFLGSGPVNATVRMTIGKKP
jgi:hypothetical protein